tara:strand:- start:1783 stop:2736 length:954 start_codon:yes stop_codon:yes gene_type:complete
MWSTVFFGLLGGGLGLVLTLMGIKLDTEALRQTVMESRVKIAKIGFLHYIAAPASAIITAKVLDLNEPRTLALYLVSITPPTVAAAIATFAVGGNVELASASSIIMLVGSFAGMPLIFSAMIQLTFRGSRVKKIEVPYPEMSAVLGFFVVCKCIGISIQKYCGCTEKSKETTITILKRSAITCMLSGFIIFLVKCKDLVKSTFYSGHGWQQHYAGCVVFMALYIIASIVIIRDEQETRNSDAIIITALRKNPGITLSVAALSLRRLDEEDYNTAMGMLLAYGFILDWCGAPVILTLRKLRKGYYCYKSRAQAEPQRL